MRKFEQIGEKSQEIIFQPAVVALDLIDGSTQIVFSGDPFCDPVQGDIDPIEGAVARQPVLF